MRCTWKRKVPPLGLERNGTETNKTSNCNLNLQSPNLQHLRDGRGRRGRSVSEPHSFPGRIDPQVWKRWINGSNGTSLLLGRRGPRPLFGRWRPARVREPPVRESWVKLRQSCLHQAGAASLTVSYRTLLPGPTDGRMLRYMTAAPSR